MTNEEKRFLEHRPVYCEECGGKMFYHEAGQYQCEDCGKIALDDYGKIKEYLEENKNATAKEISEATGVEMKIIGMFLRDGRIQIPKGSRIFIKCKRCGCALRSGRYCEDCTRELAGELKGAFYENAGEKAVGVTRMVSRDRMYYAGKSNSTEKK